MSPRQQASIIPSFMSCTILLPSTSIVQCVHVPRSVHSRTLCGSFPTSPTVLYTATIRVHVPLPSHGPCNDYTDHAIHCVLATRSMNSLKTGTRREGRISDTLSGTWYATHGELGAKDIGYASCAQIGRPAGHPLCAGKMKNPVLEQDYV